MIYKVSYRRRSSKRYMWRIGTHHSDMEPKEFIILLLQEYNRTNKRIRRIDYAR